MARRRIDRGAAKSAIVQGSRRGLTLAEACAAAGVHVATACRWRASDSDFREALDAARREFSVGRYAAVPAGRPSVPWHGSCPECRARVVVRTAAGRLQFWRCGRWPHCGWASWRPRHPRNCRACGGVRYWSHSRLSVACAGCGMRILTP
jgi:hypothetical protein